MIPHPGNGATDYLARVLDVVRVHPPRRGEVMYVFVAHDADCQTPITGAPCTCSPEITLERDGGRS